MEWKQPIPTNLDEVFGDDKIAMMLYILLVLRASNSDTTKFYSGKYLNIKRGQAIFGRNSTSKYFGLSPSGIEKVLKRLEVTGKVTCKKSYNCTLVTISEYDSVVAMEQAKEQESNRQVTGKEQASNTNKSVESVKNEKDIALRLLEEFNTVAGKSFKPTEINVSLIIERLREGFTEDDISFVIEHMTKKWKDDEKMNQYLRPSTIFGKTKFSQYSGEAPKLDKDWKERINQMISQAIETVYTPEKEQSYGHNITAEDVKKYCIYKNHEPPWIHDHISIFSPIREYYRRHNND
jgi:uncharacterized phage protein (TIGR02220 family)